MVGNGSFKMPEVRVGDTVFWYDGGDLGQHPAPAVVLRVGGDTLCLHVHEPDLPTLRTREGVRHIKDPRSKTLELFESGGWEHREERFLREAESRAQPRPAAEPAKAK